MFDESMATIAELKGLSADNEINLVNFPKGSLDHIKTADYENRLEHLLDRALNAEEELEVISFF